MREAAELLAEWFAWTDTRDDFVCNVGVFSIHPGAVAIVPERVNFTLEIRSLEDSVTEEAAAKFRSFLEARDTVSVSMKPVVWKGGVDLDPLLQDAVEKACEEAGVSCVRMPSGASHDANPMARITKAGMIFVPSVKGISHSKDEFTSPEDCARGADILARAILKVDQNL